MRSVALLSCSIAAAAVVVAEDIAEEEAVDDAKRGTQRHNSSSSKVWSPAEFNRVAQQVRWCGCSSMNGKQQSDAAAKRHGLAMRSLAVMRYASVVRSARAWI